MNGIICKKCHLALHYLLKWMEEANKDKRPVHKKIFWWKSHIEPALICCFIYIIIIIISFIRG